jgi:autophagy-related protein 33
VLSPRAHRHPYLLYTAILVATSSFADRIAPYVTSTSAGDDGAAAAARQQQRQHQQARRRAAAAAAAARNSRMMEASYEVLGEVPSEGTGSASGEDLEDDHVNGEDVRGEVEGYAKTSLVQTAIASVGFLVAVIGIWGDGSARASAAETLVYV